MQRILIIGATSAIAEACARRWARRGDCLFLVARDGARLQAIAADLDALRAGAVAGTATLDIDAIAAHAAVVESAWQALAGIDTVLIAPGTLPDQAACESDVALTLREFDTNGRSTIALAALLAQRLRGRRGATLAAIGSVAGDRGRASNFVYGSAKAALATYLSGLRQRLHGEGINVLTIKPGLIDTPMTHGLRKGPLWARPDAIAAGILRAIDRRAGVVYLPAFWWPVMALIRHLPEWIFRRMRF